MLSEQEAIFAARFGFSALPPAGMVPTPEALIDRLAGADEMARRLPLPDFKTVQERGEAIRRLHREKRERAGLSDARLSEIDAALRLLGAEREALRRQGLAVTLARAVKTRDPLRERLVWFWADHFTAMGKGNLSGSVALYVDETIRPHVTGSFADLLRAAALHIIPLDYLDQLSSVGPNSAVGRSAGRGLNENYARELLELHTLGVTGPYGQGDVRELARLLAGLSVMPEGGIGLDTRRGEPGAKSILGQKYGLYQPTLEAVHDLLGDLAQHPATARHIAHKLAVHFLAPRPDPALVDHLAAVFLDTGGHLMSVYAALLAHPAARSPARAKVRPPLEYLAASLIALDYPAETLAELSTPQTWGFLLGPLGKMGQPWENPGGPDGWPEDPEAWITPIGLAERMAWALNLDRFLPDLPDPRALVERALGPLAGPEVRLAAAAAESQREGVALVLVSPPFQRR